MTIQQLLLVQLGEELAEVQQSVSKALRFGLDDGYTSRDTTNGEDIVIEFAEAIAIMNLLHDTGLKEFTKGQIADIKSKKYSRVQEWLEYSRQKGILNEKDT